MMKPQSKSIAVAAVLGMLFISTIALTQVAVGEQNAKAQPAMTISELAGPWQIGLEGNTGCGVTSLLFTGTLNSSGQATGTLVANSGCGPTSNSQTLTINSLHSDGSGTANLTCGESCGWNLTIQVSPNKQVIGLVDVTDPENYLVGSAVKQ
jgi:hypothetical protein